MIESGCPVELRYDFRQLCWESPLVASPPEFGERSGPFGPPRQDRSRNRFDDEDAVAPRRASQKTREERFASIWRQLVHRKRENNSAGRLRERGVGDISLTQPIAEPELGVGPRGFGQRPWMSIDAVDARRDGQARRPCRTRRARAAAEVHQAPKRSIRFGQSADNL